MIQSKDGKLNISGNLGTILADFTLICTGLEETIVNGEDIPEEMSFFVKTIIKGIVNDAMDGTLEAKLDKMKEGLDEKEEAEESDDSLKQFEANKILDEVFKSFGL